MKITAAVVPSKNAPFELRELELEGAGPGEVLIRMVATGVCHTDQVIREQYVPVPLPAVLGHEGAGVVEQVGDGVQHVAPGDHVVLSFNSCGQCAACMSGAPGYCSDFGDRNFGGHRPDGRRRFARVTPPSRRTSSASPPSRRTRWCPRVPWSRCRPMSP